MITTLLEKPERASSGVKMWKISNKTNAQSATKSERTLPLTKHTADKARIIRVTIIGYKLITLHTFVQSLPHNFYKEPDAVSLTYRLIRLSSC